MLNSQIHERVMLLNIIIIKLEKKWMFQWLIAIICIWSDISFGCMTAWGSLKGWILCRMTNLSWQPWNRLRACMTTLQDEHFYQSKLQQFYKIVLIFWALVRVVCLNLLTFCIDATAENLDLLITAEAYWSLIENCSPPTCCPAFVSLAEWSNYQQQPAHNGLWSWLWDRTGQGLEDHTWRRGSKRSLARPRIQYCTHRGTIKAHIKTANLMISQNI